MAAASIVHLPGAAKVEVRLQKLTLRNFMGIESLEIDAGGKDFSVYADNGVGKTTIATALFYLFFGKDSNNRKDFEIKTLGADGQPIHFLEHTVEGSFEISGQPLTLAKIYKEKWTAKRGSADKEFDGHTTDHFVNGVPVSKTEYDARIESICREETFRLLTDPNFFNMSLKWQQRREILLTVCGDVSDEDVILMNPELADLPQILGNHSIEEYRKILARQRPELNEKLRGLPMRIDEVRRAIGTVQGSKESIDLDIAKLRAKRSEESEKLQAIDNGVQAVELRKQLAELDREILTQKNKQTQELGERQRAEQQKLTELSAKYEDARRTTRRHQSELDDLKSSIDRNEARLQVLRADGQALQAQVFEPLPVAEACPTCGQSLPAEEIEAARAKALSDFNLQKSTRLEKIIADGKALKAQNDELVARYESLRVDLQRVQETEQTLASEVEAERARLASQHVQTAENAELIKLAEERIQLAIRIDSLGSQSESEKQTVRDDIARLDAAIQTLEGELAKLKLAETSKQRIDELTAEEKKLRLEIETLDRHTFTIEEFIRAKVRMLTDRINERFDTVRFKLFDTQVNGGIAETCVCTVNGVPFEGALNHGARVNAGLEIINVLAEHYKVAPFVILDNSESVTKTIPTVGQQIRLVVSAADRTLRIEQKEKN